MIVQRDMSIFYMKQVVDQAMIWGEENERKK
jgi:hypothetical protein